MRGEFGAVTAALAEARRLLADHGDTFMADRLSELEDRLSRDDATALIAVVSEATGGMGSLNDRYLCRENGDRIAQHEVAAVNDRLARSIRDIEIKARVAATKRGVELMR